MQTIAANLGSMLTPIGNPQNLYLFGKSNMSFPEFFGLMLPYSLVALLLLVCWIWIPVLIEKMRSSRQNGGCQSNPAGRGEVSPETVSGISAPAWRLLMYLLLFVLSLLGVARILPVAVVFLIVLGFAVVADRGVVRAVDYSLLGTFVALFIFIGNLGRQQAFSDFLHHMIDGREVFYRDCGKSGYEQCSGGNPVVRFYGQYQSTDCGDESGRTWNPDCLHGKSD